METGQRPWGHYDVLGEASTHKVKRITVLPGRRLSYQRHAQRSEHWHFVAGSGVLTLDGRELQVQAGDSIDVPVLAAHRVANTSSGDLVFVEVQTGESFDEEDIIRLDDDYGRAATEPTSGT